MSSQSSGSYISSYTKTAPRPTVGSLWAWRASQIIKVAEVVWNGEEWWVCTVSPDAPVLESLGDHTRRWNDLSVFWEACHLIAAKPGPGTSRSVSVRRGEPKPDELREED